MSNIVLNGMIITLLGDGTGVTCREMPAVLVSALCALNMLLMIDISDDDLSSLRQRYAFKDYTIVSSSASKDNAVEIELHGVKTNEQTQVVIPVHDSAVEELRRVGSFKRLALVNRFVAKL
jgi:hypothetical protein